MKFFKFIFALPLLIFSPVSALAGVEVNLDVLETPPPSFFDREKPAILQRNAKETQSQTAPDARARPPLPKLKPAVPQRVIEALPTPAAPVKSVPVETVSAEPLQIDEEAQSSEVSEVIEEEQNTVEPKTETDTYDIDVSDTPAESEALETGEAALSEEEPLEEEPLNDQVELEDKNSTPEVITSDVPKEPEPVKAIQRPPTPKADVPKIKINLAFADDETELQTRHTAQLNEETLKTLRDMGTNGRINIKSYAPAPDGNMGEARRVSLARALSVREFLTQNGVNSEQIDVFPIGDEEKRGPANLVTLRTTRP